ncbi:hypothetical protein ACQP3J_29200, partial [Escherichia coli]
LIHLLDGLDIVTQVLCLVWCLLGVAGEDRMEMDLGLTCKIIFFLIKIKKYLQKKSQGTNSRQERSLKQGTAPSYGKTKNPW